MNGVTIHTYHSAAGSMYCYYNTSVSACMCPMKKDILVLTTFDQNEMIWPVFSVSSTGYWTCTSLARQLGYSTGLDQEGAGGPNPVSLSHYPPFQSLLISTG